MTTSDQISSGGMSRSYLLAEPEPAPTAKVPLIVVLHGINASPQLEEQRTGFLPIVGPAVVVYPVGYHQSWNAGTCCGDAHSAGINDVAFITAVINQVVAQHPVLSSKQVYLVGYSNGGKMAWDMACQHPSLFAAVGVYGAVPAAACPTLGRLSAIEITGLADTELTVQSSQAPTVQAGFTELQVDTLVTRLRSGDGCGNAATVVAHGVEQTTTWGQCANGTKVAYSLYAGQNHNWPATTATTPSAGSVMWSFFRSVGAT
ncbi:MAG TPA: PHB depolymerase family esterase [Acidimicrobiales bacterium]|nr:PHB depolymerase family esterase [Acidimicrobiales bacterium]